MLLKELPELNNIINTIKSKEDEEEENMPCFFSENEECDIIETILQLMYDFVTDNPTEIADPDFNEIIKENVKDLFFNKNCIILNNITKFIDDLEDDVNYFIEVAFDIFHLNIIPPRSFKNTFITHIPNQREIEKIQEKLNYLSSKPQPQQRTPEWYTFRHNLITASNAYKAFENQSSQNQLIYEKCQPLVINNNNNNLFVNVDSPLHWGQKYEPISVMIYEKMYNTRVGDFGCIQHESYLFLGASPDGINNDPTIPNRYGRMLEIKNIVNRDITGIPKKEYWIQMQLQMENCDLDECDFLETRFIEYENEDHFFNDGEDYDINFANDGSYKGIIMYFSTSEGKPYYLYKPLNMNLKEYELWRDNNMDNNSNDKTWIKNIYWKLEEYSCVLVLRNKKWFEDNIFQLTNIWNTIERERISGFSHRAPNKRIKKSECLDNFAQSCLLNLNKFKEEIALKCW